MADLGTRTPAPRDALDEYEQLAVEVSVFDRRHTDRICRAWYAPISRGARRRYDDAVQRAEQLALYTGRVTAVDDDGGALVANVAPAYARLDDLLIAAPGGGPIPVLVDVAYAILTADLLDGADLEAITNRWTGVLEGPETPRQAVARARDDVRSAGAPTQRPPADDGIDVALGDQAADGPAPRPGRRPTSAVRDPFAEAQRAAEAEEAAANRAAAASLSRRLRVRGMLALVAALVCFAATAVLLGFAGAGAVPARLAGVAAVATAILTVYGAIAKRAATRIRRQRR